MIGITISNVLVQSALVLAAGLSLTSLFAVWRIYRTLSPGFVRTTWTILGSLICILAVGDLALLWIGYTQGPDRHDNWLVGLLCFAASLFVTLASTSLTTPQKMSPVFRSSNPSHVSTPSPNSTIAATSWTSSTPSAFVPTAITRHSPSSSWTSTTSKKLNDSYGHQAGDVVLKEMGVLITAASGSRLVGRYGGEEFLVLLPQEDAADAWVTAERIRAVIEAATVVYDGDPIISPTISIGIATTFGWKEKPEDLVGLADEALYAAKFLRPQSNLPRLRIIRKKNSLQILRSLAPE